MNKIIKSIGLLALTSFLFTACNEDDATKDSILDYSNMQVTLSSDVNNITVLENSIDPDNNPPVAMLTATIAEPVNINLRVPIQVSSNLSSEYDDYLFLDAGDNVVTDIVIPALSTSATIGVVMLQTGDIEVDETLTFSGTNNTNLTVSPYDLIINMDDDYINTAVDIEINWDGQVTIIQEDIATSEVELCAVDFDFKLFDAVNFTDYGYFLASGSCPESDTFALPDGEYIIVAELYNNPHAGYNNITDIPITLSYNHEYFTDSLEDDEKSVIKNEVFNLSDTAGLAPVAYFNVSNGGLSYELLVY